MSAWRTEGFNAGKVVDRHASCRATPCRFGSAIEHWLIDAEIMGIAMHQRYGLIKRHRFSFKRDEKFRKAGFLSG